ncbi:MAG TPA: hypothetical protein VKE40_13955, partial [Gemmataceae bacterium]|nr:hypothetical protein [Gemmataceae bacterium]
MRRDPERSRRPRDAAPERPAGMGVLIGVVAACVLGFAAVAAGVGYLLWPRSDPSTAPASNNADSSAATPVVVDPPKTLDEVIKDAPRKPADAQGRLDSPPGGIRPPFPDPGRRIAPPPKLVAPNFAPVSALPIQATPLTDNLEERRLPGAVESVVSAGGGRLLLLHMPKARQLAVFDVNEGKTAKQIPVADAGALIAGGMNMFVVYSPGDNRAERWNTKTLEREGQINNPFPDPAKAIAMGSATNGPLVVALGGGRQTRLGGATLAYFDPVTGKELNYEFGGTQNAFGLGPPDSGATLRVSANGRVATAWGDPRFRRGAEVHSIDGVKITKYWERSGPHLVIPAPDGRVLYAPGQLFSPDYRPLGASKGGWPSGPWLLPAVQGDYYIAARRPDRARAGRGAPVIVEVFRNGADVPVFTIDRGSGVAVPDGLDGQTELL